MKRSDSVYRIFLEAYGLNIEPAYRTANEIDFMLMKGLTPIFIPWKIGQVYDDELYKLESVANRFGGLYAKNVLIATYLGK